MTIKGSCLCGSVTYGITGDIGNIVHCHCETCRKAHASAFSSVAAVQDSDFHICGAENSKSYESSAGKHRHFCINCGSHIYAKRDNTAHIILRLGTLDSDITSVEEKHIWVSQQATWYSIVGNLPKCQEYE